MTHVLIVDDSAMNRAYLRTLLEGQGCNVDTARHGAEALVMARQSPPQLVISDLLMPVMDGFTLLRHWKADERLKAIPFVVYTATYTAPEDERLALDLGADAFIIKPAEPEPFLARIRAVLDKGERGELLPTQEPRGEEESLLKEYSEVLIRKLEKKAFQLEQANRALQEDIARRLQAEAALREANQRLSTLVQRSPLALIAIDAQGIVQAWNPAAERLFGWTAEEVIGHPLPFVPAKERRRFEELIAGELQGVSRNGMEMRRLRKDGALVDVSLWTAPLHDAHGKIAGTIGMFTDIMERKRAEEALRVSEERHRIFAELTTDYVYVFKISPDGRPVVDWVSKSFFRLTGHTIEEFRANPFVLVHVDDHQAAREHFKRIMAGESTITERRVVTKQGEVRWVRNYIRPMWNAEHTGVIGFYGAAQDITEHKRAESVPSVAAALDSWACRNASSCSAAASTSTPPPARAPPSTSTSP